MCVCVCVCSGRVAPRPPAMRPLTSEREAVSCVSWFGHCCGSRPGRLPASSRGGPAGERCFPARPMAKTHLFIRQRAFQTQQTASPDSLWCSSRPLNLRVCIMNSVCCVVGRHGLIVYVLARGWEVRSCLLWGNGFCTTSPCTWVVEVFFSENLASQVEFCCLSPTTWQRPTCLSNQTVSEFLLTAIPRRMHRISFELRS